MISNKDKTKIREIIQSKLGKEATTQSRPHYLFESKLEKSSTYTLDDIKSDGRVL